MDQSTHLSQDVGVVMCFGKRGGGGNGLRASGGIGACNISGYCGHHWYHHLHQLHMMGVFFFPFFWIHFALDGIGRFIGLFPS